jgi:GTPase SAR1 family protein
MVWDVGGQSKIRALWKHYYDKAKGIIYVVDSSDEERINMACKELKYVLSSPQLQDAALLVLANKRDVARNTLESFTEMMDLNKLTRNWAIYPITAIKKDNNGLNEAFEWLVQNINSSKLELKEAHSMGAQ